MVRIVVSDPESGEAYQVEPKESDTKNLIGLEIGQEFEGNKIGLTNYKLQITGGTDKDGFPMRGDVRGPGRSRVVLSKGPGYQPKEDGLRKRKLLRGRVISGDTAQLNVKVIEKGEKSIEEILSPEVPSETPEEESVEEEESEEAQPEEEVEEPEPEESEESEESEETGEETPESEESETEESEEESEESSEEEPGADESETPEETKGEES
ncbi:MAG: 30S ribosomal protein S6e [Hadesarchaea archaeon]|nr:30S ribosomal protein S6e [Hadesarchaea archaeon]